MTEELLSLDSSPDEAPAEITGVVAQELERLSPSSLSALSDTALRTYEKDCFEQFQASTNKHVKDEWIHALAGALVEMTTRGISLGAKA